MRSIPLSLKTFLCLSIGTFLLLLLINIALPAVLLLFRVPSFAIGADPIWLMRWSNTVQGFGIQFNELVARRVALNRVLDYLNQIQQYSDLDLEFYQYQVTLVKGEIEQIQTQIAQLQDEHPHLQAFMNEQLRSELLAIEAQTYAELVRSGQLKQELAPLLQVAHQDD